MGRKPARALQLVSGVAQALMRRARYRSAVHRELENFREVGDIHALPEIYHYWSNEFLLPKFLESGFSGVDEFFAKNLSRNSKRKQRFLSLGSGFCDTEIRVAKILTSMGLEEFTIECLELNPSLLKRGRESAHLEGVSHLLSFTEADLNSWHANKTYDGVMANHSLHHIVNLENVFDQVGNVLADGAHFVINDMIGRNGHQRWPAALEIVRELWKDLPNSHKYNHQLKRLELEYVNWDCPTEGFEGVRSQDVLFLLLERFHFKYFFGFANVISPFIDRGFGHNFDASNEGDRGLIDRIQEIDDSGFRSGELKPTQMLAVLTKVEPDGVQFVDGLSPQKAFRIPD